MIVRIGCPREEISIHALREEGDRFSSLSPPILNLFLSTPSARRATFQHFVQRQPGKISIHALREEGDAAGTGARAAQGDFYPRPPRGGRRVERMFGARDT